MALSIKSQQAYRLAREVAKITSESLTEAVTNALRERLQRERRRCGRPTTIAERLGNLACKGAALPDVDPRNTFAIAAILFDEPERTRRSERTVG